MDRHLLWTRNNLICTKFNILFTFHGFKYPCLCLPKIITYIFSYLSSHSHTCTHVHTGHYTNSAIISNQPYHFFHALLWPLCYYFSRIFKKITTTDKALVWWFNFGRKVSPERTCNPESSRSHGKCGWVCLAF